MRLARGSKGCFLSAGVCRVLRSFSKHVVGARILKGTFRPRRFFRGPSKAPVAFSASCFKKRENTGMVPKPFTRGRSIKGGIGVYATFWPGRVSSGGSVVLGPSILSF